MRTTNPVESINSVIQRSFPGRPHIFSFIENLRLHETKKSTDLYNLTQGMISNEQLIQRRKEDQERDQKIKELSGKLENAKISVLAFLKQTAALCMYYSLVISMQCSEIFTLFSFSLKQQLKETLTPKLNLRRRWNRGERKTWRKGRRMFASRAGSWSLWIEKEELFIINSPNYNILISKYITLE